MSASPAPKGRRPYVLALGVLLLVAAALAGWLRSSRPVPSNPAPPGAPVADPELEQVLAVTNPGYVGIEVCAECHTQRAGVVKSTRHYLACRAAPEGVVSPGFEPGRGRLPTRVPGLHYEMTRSGSEFLVTRVEQTVQGERRHPFQIGLVYGSGAKYDEMYFAWKGDELSHLPVGWLYPLERWGSHDPDMNRVDATGPSCLECHVTWVAHIPGTANRYHRDNMLLGVTCERCHGPGREHVEYHRAHPNEPVAHAILHPGSLSRERSMDVCAQCHTLNSTIGRPFSYRPGQPLEAFAQVRKPASPDNDSTNQVRYLGESKCFQKSEMTCITCHDPHRLKSATNACSKCHPAGSCTDQPRLPEAVRGDCVGCHMPTRLRMHFHYYTTADDRYVPLATRSDHHIGVYPEAKQAVLLAWLRTQPDPKSRAEADRLTSELTRYWVDEAQRRQRAGRFEGAAGALREALKIGPDPGARRQLDGLIARRSKLDELGLAANSIQRLDEAIPLFSEMLALDPKSASYHRALGSIYAVMGRHDEAAPYLREIAQCDPYDASGVIDLAWVAYRNGRTEEAATLCAKAHEINPADRRNYPIWGLVLLKQERWADAEKQFRKSLLVNPTDPGSNRGLGEALRRQGQAEEAIQFARRAVRWSKSPDAEMLLTLADAYSAANRTQEARDTLEQALSAANESSPGLAPVIRERLRAVR